VTPASAAATGPTTATLSGTATPNGLATTAHWEYGLDQAYRAPGFSGTIYDQSTPAQSIGSGTAQSVPASLTNLVPNALYHARLVATNSDGTTTSSDQKFMTPKAPTPPAPVVGQTENYTPVGTVYVLQNGQFVKLTQTRQLPANVEIDARRGSLNIVAASGIKGKRYTASIGGAVFKATQSRSGATKGLTTLSLVEGVAGVPSYSSCKAKGAADRSPAGHAALSRRVLSTLRSRVSGRFRTRGRYAAGTVRGTRWTTTDRCDGTLIAVQVHAVQVTDLVKRKTIVVRAGQSYLAKAPASKKR
jgi:hypothetical protein